MKMFFDVSIVCCFRLDWTIIREGNKQNGLLRLTKLGGVTLIDRCRGTGIVQPEAKYEVDSVWKEGLWATKLDG